MAGGWNGRIPPELCELFQPPNPAPLRGFCPRPRHLKTVKTLLSSRTRLGSPLELEKATGEVQRGRGRVIGEFPSSAASPTQACTEGLVVWPAAGLASKQLMNSVCLRPGPAVCQANPLQNPSRGDVASLLLALPQRRGFLVAASSTVVYLTRAPGSHILEGPCSPHSPSSLPAPKHLWPGPRCVELE